MRRFAISPIVFTYILGIVSIIQSHVCVLRKRSDPLKGGMLRWSLPYEQLCMCQGVVADVHVLDVYCLELGMAIPGKLFDDDDDDPDTALWYIDEPGELTSRKNWNKEKLDRMLNRIENCGTWKYVNKWSVCSATCYGGTQTRTQSCVNSDNTTVDGKCSGIALSEVKACNEIPCPTWKYVNGWSACSATCYGGTQTRTQSCVNSDNTTADGQCPGNALSKVKACNDIPCRYGECYTDVKGHDYRGVVATTTSGKTCQKWTSQSPQVPVYKPDTHPNAGLGDHNYCRNPSADTEPWCYTTVVGTRWEFCDTGSPQSSCGDMPRDCYDMLHMYARNISGAYTIYPIISPARPVKVWCDMETGGGGWTVFQRRQDGSVDFYRDWAQYVSGFGNVEGEFWLGNDNIHIISNIPGKIYNLRVHLDDGIETKFAMYDGFNVTDPEDNYRLQFGGYMDIMSNAGDSLTKQSRNQPFSTHDQDHDNSSINCAERYSGAWWYGNCHASNLNGLYMYGEQDIPYAESVVWSTWKGHTFSLMKTEMKMRPIQNKEQSAAYD